MRLLTLLPLLAATVLATESLSEPSPSTAVPSSEAQTTDDTSSSSSSTASAPSASSTEEPTPAGALWTAKWSGADLSAFTKRCESKATLNAEIYKLKEMYPKLKLWAPELKVFYSKQLYPGSWEGIDVHGDQRELLKMRTEDLPFAVREWIKKTPKQRHFSVQEDVVFFAPGAIYPILPLFVDDADEKGCDDVFDDLDAYSPTAKDGAVLGKVSHKKGQKNEIEITIEAFKVETRASGRDEL